MKEYCMQTPLNPEDISQLSIGDVVYLSGKAFTCRSKLQRAVFDEELQLPEGLHGYDVLIHTGPIVLDKEGSYQLVSFMPTSSIRFEKWGARSIKEWGLKVIIGKTTMGSDTAQAMQKYGCVHLSPQSVSPNLWVESIKIEGVYLMDEMGSIEAPWKLQLNKLGPFVVDMDTQGNNLFETLDRDVRSKLNDAYEKLGIPEDFEYTRLY